MGESGSRSAFARWVSKSSVSFILPISDAIDETAIPAASSSLLAFAT